MREYSESHADCREALDNWFKIASKAKWSNLVEVQSVFPKAEAVGSFTVFNIKGNNYRLVRIQVFDWGIREGMKKSQQWADRASRKKAIALLP